MDEHLVPHRPPPCCRLPHVPMRAAAGVRSRQSRASSSISIPPPHSGTSPETSAPARSERERTPTRARCTHCRATKRRRSSRQASHTTPQPPGGVSSARWTPTRSVVTNILHIVGHIHVLDKGATREQDGSSTDRHHRADPCLRHGRPCRTLGDDYGSAGGSWCAVAGAAGCSFPLLSGVRSGGDNGMALQMFL